MNECHKREYALVRYAEGLLEGKARGDIEVHLAGCAACQRWLEEYKRLKETVQSEEFADRGDEYWEVFQRSVLEQIKERGLRRPAMGAEDRVDAGRGRRRASAEGFAVPWLRRFFNQYAGVVAGVFVVFVLVVGLARIGVLSTKKQPGRPFADMTDGDIETALVLGIENQTQTAQEQKRIVGDFLDGQMEEALLRRLEAIEEQTDFFSVLRQQPSNGTKAEEEFYRELLDIPATQNGWQKT